MAEDSIREITVITFEDKSCCPDETIVVHKLASIGDPNKNVDSSTIGDSYFEISGGGMKLEGFLCDVLNE